MKIRRIRARAVRVPLQVDVPGVGQRPDVFGACVVEVETDTGLVGHGLTGITQEVAVEAIINAVIAPALVGRDPMAHEARWEEMYWLLSPRGQTGFASHAMAAVDIALWDIKGKHSGAPIWQLLGGARASVPVYATFGFGFLQREELGVAARALQADGFRNLKMVVGHRGLQQRDHGRSLETVVAQDIARVRTVRDAMAPGSRLYIDANCSLDAFHAETLALAVRECDIGFFEEPIAQNDVAGMVRLRARTGMALACGQAEGLAFRFRDLLVAGAVDVIQPNVLIGGGFTQCLRVAGLAGAFNVPMDNGGAFPLHNMHLHGGLSNGGQVEWHLPVVALMRALYGDFPAPVDGRLTLPTAPGLGFALNPDAVSRYATPARA